MMPRRAGRFAERTRTKLIVSLTDAVIDLAVMVASGLTSRLGVLVAISLLTKLAAVCVGALVAGRGG
jgi:hypothetical protein